MHISPKLNRRNKTRKKIPEEYFYRKKVLQKKNTHNDEKKMHYMTFSISKSTPVGVCQQPFSATGTDQH